jgi:hypothetical protein
VADSLASRDARGPACTNSLAPFGDRGRPPILLDKPVASARAVIGKEPRDPGHERAPAQHASGQAVQVGDASSALTALLSLSPPLGRQFAFSARRANRRAGALSPG